MDIFEIVRTVDGAISIAVLLYIYQRLERRLDSSAAEISNILHWFMNKKEHE